MNRGLQYISLAIYGLAYINNFLLKYFVEAPNNNGVCIVQLPIYISLLTITRWHKRQL